MSRAWFPLHAPLRGWLLLALAGSLVLPWHQRTAGWAERGGPAESLIGLGLRLPVWLPLGLLPVGLWIVGRLPLSRAMRGGGLCVLSAAALVWLGGVSAASAEPGTPGLGWGAVVFTLSMLSVWSLGAAWRGACRGDAFVCGALTLLTACVGVFVLLPVLRVLVSAFELPGGLSAIKAVSALADARIWSLGCLTGSVGCGVAWNTLCLALATALGATLLGLAFALVVARTGFRFKRVLRALTVLPLITPPFVIGLALIMLFGRSGAITSWIAAAGDAPPGRGLYGFTGLWLAQLLSFTPVAFLLVIGVVAGADPALEEASHTLGGDRWTTFRRVSLPLMRPGVANAFLVVFIESMADFGNPLVLGGHYGVLSTEIYFAVVGAQNDAVRAASLALVLLGFAVGAFCVQRIWLGRRSYATVTGPASGGSLGALDWRLGCGLAVLVTLWTAFTLLVYGLILVGGFVHQWGHDHHFTLRHYSDAFGIEWADSHLRWTGTAWDSLFTSLVIAGLAAPLSAALGLLAAWLLSRRRFAGCTALELATLLSFAVPGTVLGIGYILAFNTPPLELTGTATILVLCFVFRHLPVGLRGGMAAMSQIDHSLEEASAVLGADSFTTARRVVLPLLRPALASALVYSFVRSLTSVSAVVFLVSAEHNMATAYILGLVENGHYGIAIAFASVLIMVTLACVLLIQPLVAPRRRPGGTVPTPSHVWAGPWKNRRPS